MTSRGTVTGAVATDSSRYFRCKAALSGVTSVEFTTLYSHPLRSVHFHPHPSAFRVGACHRPAQRTRTALLDVTVLLRWKRTALPQGAFQRQVCGAGCQRLTALCIQASAWGRCSLLPLVAGSGHFLIE